MPASAFSLFANDDLSIFPVRCFFPTFSSGRNRVCSSLVLSALVDTCNNLPADMHNSQYLHVLELTLVCVQPSRMNAEHL